MKERKIFFYSDGCKLDGKMYLPDDYKEGEKRPCIIPNSGYTGLNKIYPALFARGLTKAGYVCLGFDYRGFESSEGKVGYVTLENEVKDIKNAITFAQVQPEVNPEQIGLIGWGMGGPIVTKVTAEDQRVKCVASLNGWYDGERWMSTVYSYVDWMNMKKLMEEDRVRRVVEGESKYDDAYVFYPLDPATKDTWYQIKDVSDKGDYPPKIAHILGESMCNFNAEECVAKVSPRPIFIGHGKYNLLHPVEEAEAFYKKALEPKQLYWVDGKHNDFMFDDHTEFQKLIKELNKFFKEALK